MPVRELIYEFEKVALKEYSSFVILNDNRIITDASKPIANEQISKELTLGILIK